MIEAVVAFTPYPHTLVVSADDTASVAGGVLDAKLRFTKSPRSITDVPSSRTIVRLRYSSAVSCPSAVHTAVHPEQHSSSRGACDNPCERRRKENDRRRKENDRRHSHHRRRRSKRSPVRRRKKYNPGLKARRPRRRASHGVLLHRTHHRPVRIGEYKRSWSVP